MRRNFYKNTNTTTLAPQTLCPIVTRHLGSMSMVLLASPTTEHKTPLKNSQISFKMGVLFPGQTKTQPDLTPYDSCISGLHFVFENNEGTKKKVSYKLNHMKINVFFHWLDAPNDIMSLYSTGMHRLSRLSHSRWMAALQPQIRTPVG